MLRLDLRLEPFAHPHPCQVVRHVLGRDAAQLPVDPAFEPLVVVVDRLEVEVGKSLLVFELRRGLTVA